MSLYGSKVVKLVWSLAEITASQRGKNLCPRENKELTDNVGTSKRNRVNENLCGLEIGHSSMSGCRPYMEDAHFVGTIPSADDHVLLAIADGHAGDYAAKHACSHVSEALESTDEWMSYTALDVSLRPESLHLLHSALVKAFISLEEKIAKYCVENCKGDGSGTTFTVVIITPTHVICAHVGDSRCLLGSTTTGRFAALTQDHLPTDPEEEARIKRAGGVVEVERVNGELAMSRALGDIIFKQNKDVPQHEQMVICIPDVSFYKRNGSRNEVLCLTTDGIFDTSFGWSLYFEERVKYPPLDNAHVMKVLLDKIKHNTAEYLPIEATTECKEEEQSKRKRRCVDRFTPDTASTSANTSTNANISTNANTGTSTSSGNTTSTSTKISSAADTSPASSYQSRELSVLDVASAMCDYAYCKHSTDNISVIVVKGI